MKNKAIWALQIIVALAFTGAGTMKLVTAPADLRANPQMAWSNDYSDGAIKAIAGAQVLGAVGLIAPAATGILPVLTPVAGVSLAVLMGGAVSTHVRRGEPFFVPLILGTLALSAGLLRWRQRTRT